MRSSEDVGSVKATVAINARVNQLANYACQAGSYWSVNAFPATSQANTKLKPPSCVPCAPPPVKSVLANPPVKYARKGFSFSMANVTPAFLPGDSKTREL